MTDIGNLYVCFAYPTDLAARSAWERATRSTRNLSVNRVQAAIDGEVCAIVIAMTEDTDQCRPELRKARRLLAVGGRLIDAPPVVVEATRAKRIRNGMAGGTRAIARHPLGVVMDARARRLGVARRPQG